VRIVLGLSYRGTGYHGWQRQPDRITIQSSIEQAIARFLGRTDGAAKIDSVCAGRTDAGVHARIQVIHFDCDERRAPFSWVRGVNSFLPQHIRVLWAQEVDATFDARRSARRRRYEYRLLQSAVAPAIAHGLCGWTFEQLDLVAMRHASTFWLGRHDFTSFRDAECQAKSPIRTLHRIDIQRIGSWYVFEFEADAFLQHMVRNMMGALLHIGSGRRPPTWANELLLWRDRSRGPATFMPDGLYLAGISYPDYPQIDTLAWARDPAGVVP
jgi:tRNA pseudouridine38-40 synthase